MATKAGKPQYKTLVKALDELHDAVVRLGNPHSPATELAQGMRVLNAVVDRTGEVLERAKAAMARKQEARDANQRG